MSHPCRPAPSPGDGMPGGRGTAGSATAPAPRARCSTKMGCVEAFAGRVVGAGPDRAHRSGDPELIAEIGEGPGSVLGSVVGVEHGAVQATAGRGWHPQCVGDQTGAHVVGDGPADDFAAEAVQHGREIMELPPFSDGHSSENGLGLPHHVSGRLVSFGTTRLVDAHDMLAAHAARLQRTMGGRDIRQREDRVDDRTKQALLDV